ncbi:hypothetical protein CCO03_16580 [Comamonas serinivorans]|uniref:RND transporter n=2 Tax=Comamonas serinivorans TaxID=1082851 RepID=A0A1Y0EQY8_9BURK|nr:hypothetical protein CCO03_16580 [Comamonas serinivorans]
MLLTACAPTLPIAPEAAQPTVPTGWRADPLQPAAAPEAVDLHTRWWQALGDAQLNALVDRALAHNNNLGLAAARVAQARAEQRLAEAAQRPTLDASLGVNSSHSLLATGPGYTRSLQPGLQASWEPDLWGRLGDLARAGSASTAASQADEAAARVALAAQVVQAYVALRALDAQLAVAQATERSRLQSEQLTADQARTGYASQLPLAQAQAETASVRQNMAQLDLAIRRQEDALRLLSGDPPGPVPRGLPLSALQLPQPAAIQPSALLRRRPDIAAAEARLAAGDARLAAQRAAFLPHVQLSASLGSLVVNALDYNPLTVWSLGASALAPLFDGGRRQAQMDAAAAQRDQLAWTYRDTVLRALDDVQASLSALPRLAQQQAQAKLREEAVTRALSFSKDRYEAGYASYLETLDAQRNLFTVQLARVSLRQTEMDNLIALYRALGGGWVQPDNALGQP